MDVDGGEHAKDGGPEDAGNGTLVKPLPQTLHSGIKNRDQHIWKHLQKDEVPTKREVALELRDHKDEASDRTQDSDDYGVDPARVLVLMSLPRIADVGAVKADDRNRKDELEEAKDGVDDEAHRGARRRTAEAERHLALVA